MRKKGHLRMANQVKDPVCGMMIDQETAQFKSEHMGQTYYFCSSSCKSTFDQDPMKYAHGQSGSQHSSHA